MNSKYFFPVLLILFISNTLFAQRNEIVLTHKNQKTSTIKAGDNIRLSYPAEKLPIGKNKTGQVGIRGKIDAIEKDKIVLKAVRGKNLELDIHEITAIKKTSSMLPALAGTYAVIGGAALAGTSQADLNSGIKAFSAVAAIFPALIITTKVFYPAKPKQKVGQDYQMEVISVQ